MSLGFGLGLQYSRLSGGGSGYNAFIIEVKTDNAGTSNDNQFQFTGAVGDYDVIAKQNDIVVATFNDLSDEETITFANGAGTYVLEVNAKEVNPFNIIRFNDGGDKLKITDVKQWGNIVWSSFNESFRGCINLLTTATDAPDLTNVTSIFRMFFGASVSNPFIDNWNVINVINMQGFLRFADLSTPNPQNWNVINATNMSNSFTRTNMSVENLTACYENWSQLSLQQNVAFGAGTTKYNTSGQAGRDILVNTYNWSITDGGPA